MEKVIVSLTSFPAAIHYAVKAVKSILEGSVLPDKVVLYLIHSEFGEEGLPSELTELADSSDIFEIRYYEHEIRSYTKLIPALKDFPDAVIVTVDDDVYYHRNMLRDLLKMHKKFPEDVIAHRARRIKPTKSYKTWKKLHWYNFLLKRTYNDYLTLQTGVGGALYPAGCLKSEMLTEDQFRKYAPTADDIWFWAAATANGRKVRAVPFGHTKTNDLDKPGTLSLKIINYQSGDDRNIAAFNAIMEHYPDVRERVMIANRE